MKTITIVAFLAACVAASIADSAPKAVDWNAVRNKITEVRGIVRDGVNQVKTIANNDNAEVGASIGQQLDAATAKALLVFERANSAIDAESLTAAQAEALFDELEVILNDVRADLQDELAQLSETAATQIREIFYGAYEKIEEKAQELYALLRQ